MSVLTVKYYIDLVNSFIQNIRNNQNAYYVYCGQSQPWANSSGGNDDTAIINANNSVQQFEQDIYDSILYGKLIGDNDVQNLIPRINWANNTYYDRYDQSDANLFNKSFYVMTDNYQVYKVINNNLGSNSVIKPTLTNPTSTFKTGDGYVWKYMYMIDAASNTKFTSVNYIPCLVDANVQFNAIPGTIDSAFITNGGSDYRVYETGFLQNFVNTYSVQLPNTSSQYNNFYTNSSIYLKAGYGAGQIRQIGSYDGTTKKVITTKPFYSYTHLELANAQGIVAIGQLAYQSIDYLSITYAKGYFNVGDVIVQTNSAAAAVVVTSNTSTLGVTRSTTASSFIQNFAVRNTSQIGNKQNGYVSITSGTNVANAFSAAFNSNSTYINSSTEYITLGAANGAYFANGDLVVYLVAAGNTVISGLTNGYFYYVVGANSTALQLSSTLAGSAINITSGLNESGHSLTDVLSLSYSVGDYIRVGSDANNDIRRVLTVSNTSLVVDTPFYTTNSVAQHYNLPYAAMVSSITPFQANGYVSDVNISGQKINISNLSIASITFTVGEKVDLVNSSFVNQGANGIVAYANSSTVLLSAVIGTWTTGLFMRGESSRLVSNVDIVISSPNITLSSPINSFLPGNQVLFQTGGSAIGNAMITTTSTIPNNLTEYVISPTVNISGDGSNALAYAVVNNNINSTNNIQSIVFLNPGSGYTKANISFQSSYGTGAAATPIISPINGHGYDTITELGGRYCGVSTTFDIATNENYTFPSYGSFRRIGILKNPKFDNIIVNLNAFDRSKLIINNTVGSFIPGEIILNATNAVSALLSNASGICVYSNSTFLELKNVKGTFSNTSPLNHVYGVSSTATANIANATVSYFTVGAGAEVASELTSKASGYVSNVISTSQIKLANVVGQFGINDVVYDPNANSYANVTSIFSANGQKDVSYTFGLRFNQTARITLTSNTAAFQQFEYVNQTTTNANGKIISITNELDLAISMLNGRFTNGQVITDQTTNANGTIIFANTTYLKLTNVSQSFQFNTNDVINNIISANATITAVYPVLLLNDVNGVNKFAAGTNNIVGQISGANGLCIDSNLITYPDLVRESGSVLYLQNFAPITKTANSQEQIKLVIKF